VKRWDRQSEKTGIVKLLEKAMKKGYRGVLTANGKRISSREWELVQKQNVGIECAKRERDEGE
jgi:hypothetical protein